MKKGKAASKPGRVRHFRHQQTSGPQAPHNNPRVGRISVFNQTVIVSHEFGFLVNSFLKSGSS
jgi:hypothetical protein